MHEKAEETAPPGPRRGPIVGLGLASVLLYGGLAAAGDLRTHLGLYLSIHCVLFAIYGGVLLLLLRHQARRSTEEQQRGEAVPGRIVGRVRGAVPAVGHGTGAGGLDAAPGSSPEDGAGSGRRPSRMISPSLGAADRLITPGLLLAVFAVAFRAVLVFTAPSLSDDIYRYVWDGRVQARGINPYRFPPQAEELRSLRDRGWESINHRDLRTIYGPASQAVFLAAAAAGLRETGFKVVFSLFDLLVAFLLAGLLARAGRSPWLAAIYAWNPLVVVEVASSGHSDPLGLSLLVLATGWLMSERRVLSIAAYALSGLARLLPFAFILIIVRRFKARHLFLLAAIVAIGFAPYAGARWHLFSGLRAYAENWDHNSILFPALRRGLEAVVPVASLKGVITSFKNLVGDPAWCQALYAYVWPAPLARAILMLTLAAGTLVISFREREFPREMLLATGLLLLVTPTLHPWYLLWVIPFAALEMSIPWIVFTGLAPLSYISTVMPDGRCPLWVLCIEWGVPALVALYLHFPGKRRAAP